MHCFTAVQHLKGISKRRRHADLQALQLQLRRVLATRFGERLRRCKGAFVMALRRISCYDDPSGLRSYRLSKRVPISGRSTALDKEYCGRGG
jgi:hypothetical protein